MMIRRVFLPALLALLPWLTARSQQTHVIEAGSRVRLYQERERWVRTMRVSAVLADTLIVEEDVALGAFTEQRRVPIGNLARVDLSIGRRNRGLDAVRFGLLGSGIGALGGVVAGNIQYNYGERYHRTVDGRRIEGRSTIVRYYLRRAVPFGAAVGVASALLRPTDRWLRLSTPLPTRVSLAPDDRGVRVGLELDRR